MYVINDRVFNFQFIVLKRFDISVETNTTNSLFIFLIFSYMKTFYSIFNYYVFDVWLLLNFVLFNYNEYGYNVLMCRVWKHVIDYHILYVDHWPMFLLHVLYRL